MTSTLLVRRIAQRTFATSPIFNMPSSDPTKLNAAGLTPDQSKSLPKRTPSAEEEKILTHIKQLYTCNPKPETYSIYAEDAVFHDPIGNATSAAKIAAQFNALPSLFKGGSNIDRFDVLETPSHLDPKTILVDQDVSYHMKPQPSDTTKTVNSLLTLERNAQGLVTRHTEEWGHQRETDHSDGIFGWMNEQRKTITAEITNLFTSSDASKAAEPKR